jgi:hypothetical protein
MKGSHMFTIQTADHMNVFCFAITSSENACDITTAKSWMYQTTKASINTDS